MVALVSLQGCGGRRGDATVDASFAHDASTASGEGGGDVSNTNEGGPPDARCHVLPGPVIDGSPTWPDCTCYSRNGAPLCVRPEDCVPGCPMALSCCILTEEDGGLALCECVGGLDDTTCTTRAAALGGTVRTSCP